MITPLEVFIGQLEAITASLLQNIEQASYPELAAFSEQREQIVQQMLESKEVLSNEHNERITRLGEYDQLILSKMQGFKNEASTWLSKQGAIREQKNAYGAAYNVDSFFVDHKK
ncbi:hypothetical protein GC101_10160 [Paenibacillus sp. LMG 31459]|uniref:Flagellar protein FliT n=1 Tax=Paenibacillus phytohabitans TaxID=2654978 RepID=A0ABX1YE45_9BACL|nr:hypothetical protein [Paenibacillus phytohabitans]NOU79243.1 hypothetical protein [Paenibacillus phytohabitans]